MMSEAALRFEVTSRGYRVTCDQAPGFTAVARTPVELARAVERGLTEAAVADYAARHGEPYDVALHDQAAQDAIVAGSRLLSADPEVRERQIRELGAVVPHPAPSAHVAHDPLAWQPLPDGSWRSPAGRRYKPDAAVVLRVVEKRANAGIGTG